MRTDFVQPRILVIGAGVNGSICAGALARDAAARVLALMPLAQREPA